MRKDYSFSQITRKEHQTNRFLAFFLSRLIIMGEDRTPFDLCGNKTIVGGAFIA
ncbi:unnamed protein product [Sphenostylis stenocarpa]|uniref:Uncharacterized protein n=1 Tax=Sphenostylis stenocarpa TaxID=92480 RepID=A0AA86VKA1_9FABA|nr:unnamed protein product [Sphenostylis stenocarpa]